MRKHHQILSSDHSPTKSSHASAVGTHGLLTLSFSIFSSPKQNIRCEDWHSHQALRTNRSLRGQYPPRAALIKSRFRAFPLHEILKRDARVQVAADHKEAIDPQPIHRKTYRFRMEQNDRHHSQRSEAVDLTSIVHRSWRLLGAARLTARRTTMRGEV